MRRTLLGFSPLLALSFASPSFAAGDPTGVWLDDSGRGAIEIKSCGKSYCGHVVWTRDTSDAKGCGRQMIGDVTSSDGSVFDGGWIYSPERKKNYDVELKPLSGDRLQVTGYAGVKLFSKTFVWTRAPGDLKRCDQLQEAKSESLKPIETAAVDPAPKAIAAPAKTLTDEPQKQEQAATLPQPPARAPSEPVKVVPAPEPAATPQSAPDVPTQDAKAAPSKNDTSDEGDRRETETADNDKPAIDLDKIFTRTKGGDCKLDLPWVKLEFSCEQK